MRFTLKQMRYFDAALRNGSIARAAEEMNISQSSITAAIDLIEQSIGVELFRRVPAKGLLATPAGTQVGTRVASFLEQARLFESDLMSLTGDPTGTLRMACYAPTAPYVLPPLLKRIAQSYPDIRIDLTEGDLNSISDLLKSGAVDLALTYRMVLPHQMISVPDDRAFTPLFHAQPWAIVPANSPLSGQESVTMAELAPLPMIVLDLPGATEYFLGLFESQELRANVVHRTKSSSVLRGLVSAEFGYSILNICGPADRDGSAGYVALPISDPLDSPTFGVAYAATLQESAIVRAVLRTGEELVREGGLDHLLMI
ncbi:LysR family transcriptional regulator [Pseudodonghicola flavimaris]|uniref:LysR family transcriptional regulator n=1 Tax=Pseudodonghicola flavimaris TaxID=3050036 RepID=A0ABT7F7T6_9RHOB|nr:LysR family transcriptional regulator [Pseudodonghicola flavimaris]MDK3020672.1 LysR family transcriptional regulator [Pseudodonghicola flavimaris]